MHEAGISIAFHERAVPASLEAELVGLYGSVYSCLAHFRVYGGLDGTSAYVARRGAQAVAIFLFRQRGRRIEVLNENIAVPAAEMARFAEHAFSRFPAATMIAFHAILPGAGACRYPRQRCACTEDSVIDLPANAGDYLASLGHWTRKKIRQYLKRLRHDWPSFDFSTAERDAASAADVLAIIALNHRRMQSRNRRSAIDDGEAARILQMVRLHGVVSVCRIDGRLCAGGIAYRIGDNFFSVVTAHDPMYDAYRLGLLANYLAIGAAIARGGREFHLMWGREPYKALLNGVHRELEQVHVFRSRLHAFLHARIVLRTLCAACRRRSTIWLLQDAAAGGQWRRRARQLVRKAKHWRALQT